MNLEQILFKMEAHGKPFVMCCDRGWHCKINMYVTAVGASFEVKSEFDKATPLMAAQECYQRMQSILSGVAIKTAMLESKP